MIVLVIFVVVVCDVDVDCGCLLVTSCFVLMVAVIGPLSLYFVGFIDVLAEFAESCVLFVCLFVRLCVLVLFACLFSKASIVHPPWTLS